VTVSCHEQRFATDVGHCLVHSRPSIQQQPHHRRMPATELPHKRHLAGDLVHVRPFRE
jgi:hypothetical protein